MALVAFRRRPYLLVGWGWYLVSLVPVLGLVQVGLQAHADRYTYLPLIGLFLIAAWGVPDALETILRRTDRDLARVDRSRKRSPRERSSPDGQPVRGSRTGRLAIEHAPTTVLLPGVIVLVLGAVAHAQTLHWRSSTALFSHAVAVTGPNGIAENSLGMALHAEGRSDEAIERFERAVRILPDYADARLNLGSALIASGRTEDAIARSARRSAQPGLEGRTPSPRRSSEPGGGGRDREYRGPREEPPPARRRPRVSHPPALAFPNDQTGRLGQRRRLGVERRGRPRIGRPSRSDGRSPPPPGASCCGEDGGRSDRGGGPRPTSARPTPSAP
jgi:hypothetical protein